jgi:multidrug resistance efflux pump
LLGGGFLGGAVALVLILAPVVQGLGEGDQPLIFYDARRGDLAIMVTERGNLESQKQTELNCEVDDYDRAGGNGTQIIYIVPNGKSVEEGELLVELDSAPVRDRLDEQVLATERARAEKIQANSKYENQISQNETKLEEAKLQHELAKMDFKMYLDDDDGTYIIARQELDLKIQEAKNQIVEARAGLAMQDTDLEGISTLYKLGYRGEGDLTQVKFKHLQAQDSLVRAINAMSNAVASKRKLVDYEHPMKLLELEGKVHTAERAVRQVEIDNAAALSQAEAAKKAADSALVKEEEKLENYRAQLTKCKIYAPHAGMAVYATESSRYNRGSSSVIAEGAAVRQRQKILTLPELTRMQVKTAVHESVVDKVQPGMRAEIRIDAFPNRAYAGTVKSIAVLPDQGGWLSSDVKVYETIVTIEETVEQLKPGMTAVVEIHIDRLNDVLSVPVQAIVQIGNDSWCYVNGRSGVERPNQRQIRGGCKRPGSRRAGGSESDGAGRRGQREARLACRRGLNRRRDPVAAGCR